MKKNAYIIFSRLPEPGKVKTRLESYFVKEICAAIQKAMLLDLLDESKNVLEIADVYLCWTGSETTCSFLNEVPDYVETIPQKEGNLGERMYLGIQEIMNKGYSSFVLTGSDLPHLTSNEIFSAFALLNEKEAVVGPTMDGGYYLIGGNLQVADVLRQKYSWGTNQVFKQTCHFLEERKISYGVTTELHDVDEPEDFFNCQQGGFRYQKLRAELLQEKVINEARDN